MNRLKEDDAAMRVAVNAIIQAYNDGERERLADQCNTVWEAYFQDGPAPSDADVLALLWDFLTEVGDEVGAARVLGDMAAVRAEPAIAKLDDSALNEESRYLSRYARNVTSQTGEDGILEKIFSLIGIENKWCVEFGAYDGKLHSNTYTLIAEQDWSGVLIEADSDRFDQLRETYAENERAHMLRELVGFDPDKDSLDFILSKTDIPQNPDLVSIDIDGNDWHIWHSLKKYHPRVVIIEFNPTVPNDVLFVQRRDFHEAQGCSLRALIALGKSKGYELACTTTYNAIFVAAADFPKLGIRDNSINAMYRPLMDGRIFHGYDSKIFTVGMPKLNWISADRGVTDRPIRHDELQLPSTH